MDFVSWFLVTKVLFWIIWSFKVVLSARELKQRTGILAQPSQKKGKAMAQETIDLVHAFFVDDEYSRQLPGEMDYVSIQKDVHKQKQLVLCNLRELFVAFKGNPNFQGVLNWIIQILHYYCRKQYKIIENSRIIEQNFAISLCSFLCLLRLALLSPSSTAGYFQFLDIVLNVTSDHSCCI